MSGAKGTQQLHTWNSDKKSWRWKGWGEPGTGCKTEICRQSSHVWCSKHNRINARKRKFVWAFIFWNLWIPLFFLSKSHWPDSHPLTIIFKSVITFALLFLFFLLVGVLLCPWACVCMLRNAHPCTRTHAYTLAHPHTRTCTHTRLSRRLFYSMMWSLLSPSVFMFTWSEV